MQLVVLFLSIEESDCKPVSPFSASAIRLSGKHHSHKLGNPHELAYVVPSIQERYRPVSPVHLLSCLLCGELREGADASQGQLGFQSRK